MSEFAYIYTYTYNYTCTYALKQRKRRSTSSPSSFPVPLVSKTAPSVSLLWRFSSTSLPFLLSTSFQSRLTVPFLLCLHCRLTPFQQQPIFKTSKVSRIRIRIYRACAVCETYEDGGTDGRTREPLTSSMEGLAHARPNKYWPRVCCVRVSVARNHSVPRRRSCIERCVRTFDQAMT